MAHKFDNNKTSSEYSSLNLSNKSVRGKPHLSHFSKPLHISKSFFLHLVVSLSTTKSSRCVPRAPSVPYKLSLINHHVRISFSQIVSDIDKISAARSLSTSPGTLPAPLWRPWRRPRPPPPSPSRTPPPPPGRGTTSAALGPMSPFWMD